MFVSSHLMSEMALTAEHLIVIGRGRLLADLSVAGLVARSETSVVVRTPQTADLRAALVHEGVDVTPVDGGALEVTGLTTDQIGDTAFNAGIRLHELTLRQASLEQAYMELTAHAVEYQGGTTTPTTAATAATATESRAA